MPPRPQSIALELDLEFTEVRAPIDGRAGRALVTVGNLAQADSTLLTTLVSLDPVHVYFEADEQTFLRYNELARRGERGESRNPVRIGLANEKGFPHAGTVDFIDNQVDPRTGTIRARAVVPNADRVFTPGLFARVQLEGSGVFHALLIDDKAVLTDQDRKYVYVLGPGNTARTPGHRARQHDRRAARRDLRARARRPGDRARRAEGVLRRHAGDTAGDRDGSSRRRRRRRCAGTSRPMERAAVMPQQGHTMDFSKFFIDRPIFAAVLSIVIFAAGLIAIPLLPISEYPDVVPPSVVVRTVYPGANPKVIAETVATPLEEAINGVEDMMYIKSVAGSDGVLQMTVTFRPGTDADDAAVRVQNRVAQALARLPEDVRRQGVTTQKQSPVFLMVVHLVSHGRQVRHAVPAQLHAPARQGRARAICRRRRGADLRRRRLRDAHLARSRTRSPRAA